MAELSIDIQNLVKVHGGTPAVDHLSLQVQRGEFFSILGPSGSGKTSTLRLLAGFEYPDSGTILIEGKSMEGVPPHLRPVNMVFQSYALFPHLTVSGNVAFGLEMRCLPRKAVRTKVGEALDVVRLSGKESRFPSQLSGGEQQRVALARALVNQPAVLLLDEPLGALDQQLRQDMQVELKSIQEQVGLTFLFVTHHQEEALSMSDRLAVMNQGRVLQVGTPQEIYNTPTSPFVAQFIGTSNQLDVRLDRLDGEFVLGTADLPARPVIRAQVPPGAGVGSRVTLMLRPERVNLSSHPQAEGFDNILSASVERAMYTGNETHYMLRFSDTVLWKVRVLNADQDQTHYKIGQAVFVRWNAGEARFLSG